MIFNACQFRTFCQTVLTVPPEKKASKKWCQMSQSLGKYNSLVFRECQLAPSTYSISHPNVCFLWFQDDFPFQLLDYVWTYTCSKVLSVLLLLAAQSCSTLYDSMDCIPPGSSVHGILQARILEVGCHLLFQGIFL